MAKLIQEDLIGTDLIGLRLGSASWARVARFDGHRSADTASLDQHAAPFHAPAPSRLCDSAASSASSTAILTS
jgi:hypothetical protein